MIVDLYNAGIINVSKQIRLKNGQISPYYFDFRKLISYPKLMNSIIQLVSLNVSGIDRICGVPLSGIPLASHLSIQTQIPMIIKREKPKDHGLNNLIDGVYNHGDSCLVIEDVVTTGSSLYNTVLDLEKNSLVVRKIVVLLDREEGGIKMLRDKGYEVEVLFTLQMVMNELQNAGIFDFNMIQKKRLVDIMNSKKSRLIVSADYTTLDEIIDLAHKIGDYICALKLHIDIVTDFTEEKMNQLVNLKLEKNFIIIQDSKFSDIGNTVRQQFRYGMFKIYSWADIVTVHAISGPDVMKQLIEIKQDIGILIVAQLSCANNLITPEYTQKAIDMARVYKNNVVGFVSQTKISNDDFLHLTPGVSICSDTDNRGQIYRSPRYVIETEGCDGIIVGRGIIESPDLINTTLMYQKDSWI